MFKLIYQRCSIEVNSIEVRVECIAQEVGPAFDCPIDDARELINARNKLGSTMIANDFDLPHLEITGLQQGLALIEFVKNDLTLYHSLVLVVDSNKVSKKLQLIMPTLLQDENIKLLRECHSEQTFTKLIKEMDNV